MTLVMTTIAYKDGIIAADSQLTIDDVKVISSDKIKILNKDTIFAGAGDSSMVILAERFFAQSDWEEKLNARPEIPEKKSVEGILISKGRVFIVDSDLIPDLLNHPFYAVGSGWKFALAAMHTGLSAVDAVAFAAEFDVNTNNKIRWLDVKQFNENSKTKSGRKQRASPVEIKEKEGRAAPVQGNGEGRPRENE